MKPDTFDFDSLPSTTIPVHHLIISPHMHLNRKTHETVCLKKFEME